MSHSKRTFTGKQKIQILKSHLLDRAPVSDLCSDHGIRPTLYYRWQKEFFEKGAQLFGQKKESTDIENQLRLENEQLKQKLLNKNEVVSELMDEYIQLKKRLGGT